MSEVNLNFSDPESLLKLLSFVVVECTDVRVTGWDIKSGELSPEIELMCTSILQGVKSNE